MATPPGISALKVSLSVPKLSISKPGPLSSKSTSSNNNVKVIQIESDEDSLLSLSDGIQIIQNVKDDSGLEEKLKKDYLDKPKPLPIKRLVAVKKTNPKPESVLNKVKSNVSPSKSKESKESIETIESPKRSTRTRKAKQLDPDFLTLDDPEGHNGSTDKQLPCSSKSISNSVLPQRNNNKRKADSDIDCEIITKKNFKSLLGGREMNLKLWRVEDLTIKVFSVEEAMENAASKSAGNSSRMNISSSMPQSKPISESNQSQQKEITVEFPEFETIEESKKLSSILFEVCVDNFPSVLNASKGGAGRIELCSALSEGGLTPTHGLLNMTKAHLRIPIFVMIRPRGGDFIYSQDELEIMVIDIIKLKEMGADGFVFGVLDKNGQVDEHKCKTLLRAADPLPCTFHRAFDHAVQPLKSLQTIIKLGFTRILTSGQQPNALKGIPYLKQLVLAAGDKIIIMAGAGVNPQNVAEIVSRTGVKEIHGSARVKVSSQMYNPEGVSRISMGTLGNDDSSYFVTDIQVVNQIIKNSQSSVIEIHVSS